MSSDSPTSPDDPEWVDEIVRRALERAAGGDPGPAVAATQPPAAVRPDAAHTRPVAAPRQPVAQPAAASPASAASPAPTPSTAPQAAPRPAPAYPAAERTRIDPTGTDPTRPAQPQARPAQPAAQPAQPQARPASREVPAAVPPATQSPSLDDLFGDPAPQRGDQPARLPAPDDLVSAYPVDAQSARERPISLATTPYPDLEPDPMFDDAIGAGLAPEPRDDAMGGRMRGFLEWGAVIVGALAVALIIKTFLMQAYFIPSGSMEPTLQIGDRVLVNKLSYDFGDVGRGDLVVFNRPPTQQEGEDDLIKRVIALPGETIAIDNGQIFITATDGTRYLLEEPYLVEGIRTTGLVNTENCVDPQPGGTSCQVPDGHVFVMGDNRPGSRDSRVFGPIPEDLVVGRAFLRVWPIGDLGFL